MRISPTLYILYLFVFLLVACNRRELTYSPEATITISADWSQSGLNEKEQDYGATAIFYPTDGSTPFVALMGDRTYKTLCLSSFSTVHSMILVTSVSEEKKTTRR